MIMPISILRTIATVTGTSLMGMTLGGLFGYVAGKVSPQLFEIPLATNEKVDPIATATIVGAAGGVFCGGALGAFAIAVQMTYEWSNGMKQKQLSESEKRSRG